MAQFCTKCGAPLTEGVRFCTGCGAAVAGPPAAAQPVEPLAAPPPGASAAPAGAAPTPATPPASSGSPVLKIVLAVIALLLVFGLLAVGACAFFLYRAKQRVNQIERQARATFPMPTGTREVRPQPAPSPAPSPEAAAPIATDVAVYPGATASEGGGETSMGGGAIKVQQYVTSDSVDKVVSFYKDKLGPKALVQQSNNQALVQLAGSNGMISIVISPDESSGKTKISITRIGK